MSPKWIIDIFKVWRCDGCMKPLFPTDIERIGLEYRLSYGDRRDPFVYMEVCCSCCQETYRLSQQRKLKDIQDAIAACHFYLFQGPPKRDTRSGCVAAMASKSSPLTGRLNFPPTTPMPDAKVRAFLNRLERTSFKRNTKSYRKWMLDLGVDIDKKGAGTDDIPF